MTNISEGDGAGPPKLIAPDFDAIEAAGLHQMGQHWCAWKLEPRPGGKPAKTPYRSRVGKGISTSETDRWIPYEDAKQLFQGGGFSGIGYLPMPEDVIVGLDADGVLSADGTVLESGLPIVAGLEAIGCYMERSPSGKGLRAWVRGIKDGKQKVTFNGHSVECYQPDEGWTPDGEKEKPHYLTITGAVWGDLRPVDAGQEAQQRLENFLLSAGLMESDSNAGGGEGIPDDFDGWQRRTDDEVESLLRGSLNLAGKINKAWNGDDTVSGGRSESRGLVLKQLWYITRDADQIRRVVLRSKLDQSRFTERRNGYTDFLAYEIDRAGRRQKRNHDADRAAKRDKENRKQASALALKNQAQEVTGGAGIDDLLSDGGKLTDSLHTASELLIRDGRLAGVVWWNEFAGQARKSISLAQAFADKCAPKEPGPWLDDDTLAVEAWLPAQWRVSFPNATVKGAVRRWSRATSMNPVTDRIQQFGEEWDGTPRLDSWLIEYMGAAAADDEQAHYLAEVGKRFLIGVVARGFQPGAQQHQMLVMEGPQGAGKSAAVRALALAVNEDAYLESFVLHEGKDCLLQLRGKLIGEWAELVGFGKREAEAVKDFLSRCADEYRDPYGTNMQKWPRTVSFFATTNESEYLRDATGNRRYWPVRVGVIELDKLRDDAPQLLGEAVRLYQAGARWWVDPQSVDDALFRAVCDREQRGRLVATALDDRALDLADRSVCGRLEEVGAISVPDMQKLMFPNIDNVSQSDWYAATTALKRVGWESKKINGRIHWFLGAAKTAELRSLHGMPEPMPKGKRGLRRVQ